MLELDPLAARRGRAPRWLAALAGLLLIVGCDEPADRGNGMMDDGMMMDGMMGDRMPEWMMSQGRCCSGEMMQDMRVIHSLLTEHQKIDRRVENIPGGVRTITVSSDPRVADLIRAHVRQMKRRLESGDPIRMMDPLFREIFRHHEAIQMEIEDIEGGVRVTETSDDPQVTSLIRQHARRAVTEFVKGGMRRAMQPTPLPEGYEEGASADPGRAPEAPR